MNYSPAYVISRYLIDEGLVSDPSDSDSWPCFVANLPDEDRQVPHNALVCVNTNPDKDGRLMTDGTTIFHHGVQILLRCSDHTTGYAKAKALVDALDLVDDDQVDIGSLSFVVNNVSQTSGVVALGQEEGSKRREMFSMNFLVTLQEV